VSHDLTDDLVAAAQKGDGRAFEKIYLALAPSVMGYLRAKGVVDPPGVTNDVFLGLLRTLPTVRGGAEGLRKVVFSIAHARMVDEHRRRGRTPTAVPYEVSGDTRADPAADAAEVDTLGRMQVMAVLATLPDDQRDVLALRVVADLSLEQTARVMGRSTGAVKQLQRRALIAVRTALERQGVTL
jgi:RNA polymerase sigma-70 factor (ECF subfamily)